MVFKKDKKPLLSANNVQLSEDDNILSRGIQGNKYAIGYFGYAYYEEKKDSLNILSINSIKANEKTVANNTYPLSRPLFMYSSQSIMEKKPQVAAFLAYVLNNVNDRVVEVGYFPAPKSAIDKSKKMWIKATKKLIK